MSNNDSRNKPPPQQPKKLNETRTTSLNSTWSRNGRITNTLPAPENPHKQGGQKEKK